MPAGRARAALRLVDRELRVGQTTSEDIRSLGNEPRHSYSKDTAPGDYYLKGWERRERPITGSVLIFMLQGTVCYVWFDAQGLLKDDFVGGT